MLSGFTLVRNAVKIDFPIVPAIRSVLEVCDEVVVNVGQSEDDTRDLVAAIDDPREALAHARRLGRPVLVTGSLYLLADLADEA